MLSTAHRRAAQALVVIQALAVVYLLSSAWVTLGVAAAFVLTVTTVRRLAPH
ncbi:hypothetical protein Lesp02_52070 [Lentzea sp. NBRC 105346]|uniref:hypothetical protein n=1 Tax=Lentzea sp. NBRC 105346 TaxID=3032205 RepID=UPI0024A49CFD|nr:hypothetical protein [Lentzea sp. NBRC 105346]GLZ33019.1 hypothetical protein Lesp02_52070 [Lentzea sp. NBRC 105346]